MNDPEPMRSKSGSAAGKIRVAVLEDFPVVREGLVQWIKLHADLDVAWSAAEHGEARARLAADRPDLLLLDLMIGGRDGIDFIEGTRAAHPTLPLLVFSIHDEGLFAERVLRAGANGYVMKRDPSEQLLTAIRTVAAGELFVSAKMSLLILKRVIQPGGRAAATGIDVLTNRELHVFQLIGAGLTPRAIAAELGVSVKTAEAHREHIKNKLGLQTAADVIRQATLWVREQSR